MPQSSYQIKSPALNDDAEYASLLQQLSAFSPAKLMASSLAMQRQEEATKRYEDNQEKLLRAEDRTKSKDAYSLIGQALNDYTTSNYLDDAEEKRLVDNLYGGELLRLAADGNYEINPETIKTHIGGDAETQNAFINAYNVRLKIHGNKQSIQEGFDTTVADGIFPYQVYVRDEQGNQTDVTKTLKFNIFDEEQIFQYANNPELAEDLFYSWQDYKSQMSRLKPVGSSQSFIKVNEDIFAKGDRNINAIKFNSDNVKHRGKSFFIRGETKHEDFQAGVLHGKMDMGSLAIAEHLEEKDITDISREIASVKATIDADKRHWMTGISTKTNKSNVYLSYMASNQDTKSQGDKQYAIRHLEMEQDSKDFKISIYLPISREPTGLKSISDIYALLDKEARMQDKKLSSGYKKISQLNMMANYRIKEGEDTLLGQYYFDHKNYLDFYQHKGVEKENPSNSANEVIMDLVGVSHSEDTERSGGDGSSKPKDSQHFIQYDDKRKNAPFRAMYNLMLRWTQNYVADNKSMKIPDGGWNAVFNSPDFKTYISERMKQDEPILNKIYSLNEGMIEEGKVKNKTNGIPIGDKIVQGLVNIEYEDTQSNKTQRIQIDLNQKPDSKNNKMYVDLDTKEERTHNADLLDSFIIQQYEAGNFKSVPNNNNEPTFTETLIAKLPKEKEKISVDEKFTSINPETYKAVDKDYWLGNKDDPKRKIVHDALVKLQNKDFNRSEFWAHLTEKIGLDRGLVNPRFFGEVYKSSGQAQEQDKIRKQKYAESKLGGTEDWGELKSVKGKVRNIVNLISKDLDIIKKGKEENKIQTIMKEHLPKRVEVLNRLYKKLGLDKQITIEELLDNPDLAQLANL